MNVKLNINIVVCILFCALFLNCGDDGGGEESSPSVLSMDSSTSSDVTEEESDGSQGETGSPSSEERVQLELTLFCPQCKGYPYWFIFYVENTDEGAVCGIFSGDDALYCEEGNCSLEYLAAEEETTYYSRSFLRQKAPAINIIKLLVISDGNGNLLLDLAEYFVDLWIPLFEDTSLSVEPYLQDTECREDDGGESSGGSTVELIETMDPSTGGQESEDTSSLETALSTDSTTGGETAEESTAETSSLVCGEDESLVTLTLNLLPQDDNAQLVSEFGAGWCDPQGCEERQSGVGRVEVFRGCLQHAACRGGIRSEHCEWTANFDNGAYWLVDWVDANGNRVLDEGECRLRHPEHAPQFVVDGAPTQCTFGQNRDPCVPETCACNVWCPFP